MSKKHTADAHDLIHPDDRAMFCRPPGVKPTSIDWLPLTYRVKRKDGQYVWLETLWKVIAARADDGAAEFEIVAISRDVTVRREAATRLAASEARLRSILDAASDGIVTVDESGRIEQFNSGAERLFGYRAPEVLGHNVRILFPPAATPA